MRFVQLFSNKWIPSLKYVSGRAAKYPSTAGVTILFDPKYFPATNFLGLGTDEVKMSQI